MPKRIIEDAIKSNEQIDKLSWFEEVVYYRLLVSADDFGRFDGRPAFLRSALFPIKDNVTKKALSDAIAKLTSVGLLQQYEVNGKPYLCFPTWDKHQRIRNKYAAYPAPMTTRSNSPQIAANCSNSPQFAANCQHEVEVEVENEVEVEPEYNSLFFARARTKKTGFVPPTVEEIAEYVKERGSKVDPQGFYDYYAARNWMMGKTPMDDWQAACRSAENWERWEKKPKSNSISGKEGKDKYFKSPEEQQAAFDRMQRLLDKMEGGDE